ncbi:MAG: cadherin domain-containing protein, partial [Nitrospira sp.]|nr:cadherin domain-containing protein [Nitrospira sp.]
LVRFNPDGSLDTTFDLTTNTLDGTPTYIEDGSAVVLDVDVDISDSELDALNGGTGNYSGASLTLARHGGANAEDVLSFSDGNGITLVGGNLIKNSQILATFNTTSIAGEVVITFTDANGEIPTSADVDNILRQITYANTSNTPSANVQLDWTFDDGNTGSQGTGGALQATGSTVVSITAVNDVPVNTVPGAQTVNEDTSLALTGISVNDVDGNLSTVQLAVTNGTVTVTLSGAATISAGANGTNTLTLSGGQADINATLASLSYQGTLNYTGSDMLTITSTDAASATDVDMVAITVVGNNTPPVITNFGNMANATFSLAENLTAVASIAATDADEDPVSYSIIGGADAARFTIDATSGALRFTSAPDFENPQDTGGDNTYDVVVQASDGQGGTDTQSWAISVTDVFEGGMAISPEPTLEPTPDPTPDPTPEPPPGPLPEPTSDAGSSESTGSFAGWNNPLAGAVIDQSLGGGASEASVGHVLEREVEFGDIRDGQDVLTLPPFLKPSSWATTSDQIRSYYGEPIDIVKSELSSEFLQHLRASSDEIDQAITDQRKEHSLLVNMAKQTGLALSAGFVAWMVRGGALVASLMASLPAWRHFDPIPILGMDKKDKEAWSRRVKEAASLEAREHRGLEQILHAKHTEPLPPDSNSTTRSGSS